MMPRIRIFVPTYRRPRLLRRALESLLAQTFTDWTAEIHNDDPLDGQPATVIATLHDPRLQYHPHAQNLGGTRSFNLFFQPVAEPFYSMLEDDNWWEPRFLETMIHTACQHPRAQVLWCNQRVWQETSSGQFLDTGQTTQPVGDTPCPVPWGDFRSAFGAVFAHGCALIRSEGLLPVPTPAIPIAFTEPFRERAFPWPLLFVPQPLAHFTLTRHSARSNNRAEHAELQTMLAATFLHHARWPDEKLRDLWQWASSQNPPATSPLLLAALHTPAARVFWNLESPPRLFRLLLSLILRPRVLWRLLRSRSLHAGWWNFLHHHTAARFAAATPP